MKKWNFERFVFVTFLFSVSIYQITCINKNYQATKYKYYNV